MGDALALGDAFTGDAEAEGDGVPPLLPLHPTLNATAHSITLAHLGLII